MVANSDIVPQKPKLLESRRIKLISPILHIGAEVQKLNPFEYVETSDKIYIPNQQALWKALYQKGGSFLNEYIAAIEQRQDASKQREVIRKLLENAFGKQWWNTTALNGDKIFPDNFISRKWAEDKISDLRPMIRNGMGQLYIPGSSIKGAIRTAIAYHLLRNADKYQVPSNQQASAIEEKLKAKLGELKRKSKSADDEFMNSFFSDYTLTHQNRTFSGNSQNTDILRALHVTDSNSLLEKPATAKNGKKIPLNLPVVPEVIVSSRFPDYRAKYKAPIYAEMVRNVDTEFTISLDTEMLSWFKHKQGMKLPFNNLDELLAICQEFTQEQWDYEHDYWESIENNSNAAGKNLNFSNIRDFYAPEKCPYALRLGWGSGMTGTTIGLCLSDDLRATIRDICSPSRKAPGYEAPKSRRTIKALSGDIKFVPGWVKFKV